MSNQNNQNQGNNTRGNNGQQSHQQQSQRQQDRHDSLVNTTLKNLEMVSVGWNITDSDIELFLNGVMEKANIPLAAVRLKRYKKGDVELAGCYAIFPSNDPRVVKGAGQGQENIIPYFREHLQQAGIELTKECTDILKPFIKGDTVVASPRPGYLLVELDLFEVVGMILYYDPNTQRINIPRIAQVGHDIVLTAYKTIKTKGKTNRGSRDKFYNMI